MKEDKPRPPEKTQEWTSGEVKYLLGKTTGLSIGRNTSEVFKKKIQFFKILKRLYNMCIYMVQESTNARRSM